MEEFEEADVLWPWPDTPPPSPEEEAYSPAPELFGCDNFSCEPFSEPSLSSASTSSAPLFDRSSSSGSEDGFFLSGPSTVVSGLAASTEEFLEADVLWPDTAYDEADGGGAVEFWCRSRRRVEEAAAACGKREGWRPMVSSPIDIPVAATGVAAARRRLSPSAVPVHRRR